MSVREENRLAQEAGFWNVRVGERRRLFRRHWYTEVNRYMWRRTLAVLGDLTSQRVLFVGCGQGASMAKGMAQRGGEIWCLDISVDSLRQFSKHPFGNLSGRVHTVVGDAEHMPFEMGSFDVVVGKAIVHHLNVPTFMKELCRVCIPEGRIVFCEPLGTNPLINLFRWLTPTLRVPSEHPLKQRDIQQIRGYCKTLSCEYREFITAFSFPCFLLGFRRLGHVVHSAARAAECALFYGVPFAKWMAWAVILDGRLPA